MQVGKYNAITKGVNTIDEPVFLQTRKQYIIVFIVCVPTYCEEIIDYLFYEWACAIDPMLQNKNTYPHNISPIPI